jgi:hypothetical protein
MLEAYSVLLLVSMVVLEIAISILPSSKRATFARSRIVISALIFLFFTVLITNPFDWIPQGHHAIRSPYWDVFALNLAGAVVFWLLTSGIPRNKKQIHESPS